MCLVQFIFTVADEDDHNNCITFAEKLSKTVIIAMILASTIQFLYYLNVGKSYVGINIFHKKKKKIENKYLTSLENI